MLEPAVRLEPADGAKLRLRGAARADDVRVVRVGEPVRPRAGRGDDGALLEAERGPVGAEEGEELGDRVRGLRVGDGVPAAVVDGEAESLGVRQRGEELGALDVRAPKLEVGVPRPAHGPGGEERAAQVRGAAARAAHDPRGRPLQRREARVEHACLVQHLEGAGVVVDVDLKARRVLERLALERADLAGHVVRPQKREGAPRDGRARHLQVKGDPPTSPEVDAARGADER